MILRMLTASLLRIPLFELPQLNHNLKVLKPLNPILLKIIFNSMVTE